MANHLVVHRITCLDAVNDLSLLVIAHSRNHSNSLVEIYIEILVVGFNLLYAKTFECLYELVENHLNKCKECGGDGIVKGEELVEINIPAGVDNDMVVTVEGKGNQGKHNGLYGNLQVMVSVEKNDDFERVGQDLYHNLVLDFATATLGGEVEVPTLDGKTKIKIEPGTQPGKQIRLRGKGMPAIQGYGYGRGDIIVNITVFIPTSLTKEEKDLVVKFKECDNFKADNAEKKSLFESFKNLFKK